MGFHYPLRISKSYGTDCLTSPAGLYFLTVDRKSCKHERFSLSVFRIRGWYFSSSTLSCITLALWNWIQRGDEPYIHSRWILPTQFRPSVGPLKPRHFFRSGILWKEWNAQKGLSSLCKIFELNWAFIGWFPVRDRSLENLRKKWKSA